MAIGTIIGAIGSLILTGYGMYKQEEEAERARRAYGEETEESKRRFGAQIGIERAGLAARRAELRQRAKESDREWKWRNETDEWNKTKQFVDNFQNMVDRNPEYANNLFNIWRR